MRICYRKYMNTRNLETLLWVIRLGGIGAAGRHLNLTQPAVSLHIKQLEARLADAPYKERYTLLAYEPDLGDVLAAADLVLGRSGGSIFEVTAAGRPAILVPYPHATADHQSANAAWMQRAGAATVIADEELGAERLAREVGELLGNPARLAERETAV